MPVILNLSMFPSFMIKKFKSNIIKFKEILRLVLFSHLLYSCMSIIRFLRYLLQQEVLTITEFALGYCFSRNCQKKMYSSSFQIESYFIQLNDFTAYFVLLDLSLIVLVVHKTYNFTNSIY